MAPTANCGIIMRDSCSYRVRAVFERRFNMANVVPGALKVSNDCIADLAGYAALECYGVVGMAVTDQ